MQKPEAPLQDQPPCFVREGGSESQTSVLKKLIGWEKGNGLFGSITMCVREKVTIKPITLYDTWTTNKKENFLSEITEECFPNLRNNVDIRPRRHLEWIKKELPCAECRTKKESESCVREVEGHTGPSVTTAKARRVCKENCQHRWPYAAKLAFRTK